MKIRRGITHCDTIGDIFQNPVLHGFVCEWYLVKNNGEKALGNKRKKDGGIRFTPAYYEFIRQTFEDRSDMEDFLNYIRERILVDEALFKKIKDNFDNYDIIKALLSFDEINDQLATVEKLTISGIFKTRVVDIIYNAQDTAAHIEDPEEEIYANTTIYGGLLATLENDLFPISEKGQMLCRIDDGASGHVVSVLGEGNILEVNDIGSNLNAGPQIVEIEADFVLDTREKVISRIQLLERIVEYHFRGIGPLTETDEEFYIKSRTRFELRKDEEKFIKNPDIRYKLFGGELQETKEALEKSLKKMGKKPLKLELVREAERPS